MEIPIWDWLSQFGTGLIWQTVHIISGERDAQDHLVVVIREPRCFNHMQWPHFQCSSDEKVLWFGLSENSSPQSKVEKGTSLLTSWFWVNASRVQGHTIMNQTLNARMEVQKCWEAFSMFFWGHGTRTWVHDLNVLRNHEKPGNKARRCRFSCCLWAARPTIWVPKERSWIELHFDVLTFFNDHIRRTAINGKDLVYFLSRLLEQKSGFTILLGKLDRRHYSCSWGVEYVGNNLSFAYNAENHSESGFFSLWRLFKVWDRT